MKYLLLTFSFTLQILSLSVHGDTTVDVYKVSHEGVGDKIGEVTIKEESNGLVFQPNLSQLSPGIHGFHVHENGSCMPSQDGANIKAAGSAGGHLDLSKGNHHKAPWADGHTGDLPALYVEKDGKAKQPVYAPDLSLEKIKDRAIIIHEGGDNYKDTPKPLGGGGERVACGVINMTAL